MYELTVVTATFNRCEKLARAYASLCRQDCDKFVWLIVDDGSTDGTGDQVDCWKKENKIPIKYYYKENGGVTLARQIGRLLVNTYWLTVLDSDDYLTDGALREILELLDTTGSANDEKCIGLMFPALTDQTTDLREGNYSLSQQYYKNGCVGEFQLIVKTEDWNRFQPPRFWEEKFITESSYLRKIDYFYYYKCLNRRFMVREYYTDGLTKNLADVIQKNPKGQAYAMKVDCVFGKDIGFLRRVQAYIDFLNFSKNMLHVDMELFPELKVPFSIRCIAQAELRFSSIKYMLSVIKYPFPKEKVKRYSKIVLWGAGRAGKAWKAFLDHSKYCQVLLWCDTLYGVKRGEGLDVHAPEEIWSTQNYDYVLIAIQSENECVAVENRLREKGVSPEKIVRMTK